jgi:hypothetical protein
MHALREGGDIQLKPLLFICSVSGLITRIFITRDFFLAPVLIFFIALLIIFLLTKLVHFILQTPKYKKKLADFFEVDLALIQKSPQQPPTSKVGGES